MRCNLQSAVTDVMKGRNGDVKVDEVGIVAVDSVESTVIKVGDIFKCR